MVFSSESVYPCATILSRFIVEFHEEIRAVIHVSVGYLNDRNSNIRRAAIEGLLSLSRTRAC